MKCLAVAAMVFAAGLPARAAEPYCTYGHAAAILLVDRTTEFDATDRSVFLDATAGLIDRLGPGDRLVAFTMTDSFTGSRKLFDDCKPACPQASFFAGLLSTCSPTAARAQLRGFTEALAVDLARMLRDPEQTPRSDLFRTVAEATRAMSVEDAIRPIRTVIMFSDLLENSTILPERELRRLPSASIVATLDAAGVSASVRGATVRVFGFGRDDAPGRPPLPQDQRRRIATAWEAWFRKGGAAEVDIGFR